MAFLKWLDSYSVGIKEMDAQHKNLADLINQLTEAMKADVQTAVLEQLISSLINAMVVHFAAEERIMQEYGYPGYQDHRRMHGDMVSKIKTLNAQHKTLVDALSPELMSFIRTWLISHIQREDQAYGRYITSRMGQ